MQPTHCPIDQHDTPHKMDFLGDTAKQHNSRLLYHAKIGADACSAHGQSTRTELDTPLTPPLERDRRDSYTHPARTNPITIAQVDSQPRVHDERSRTWQARKPYERRDRHMECGVRRRAKNGRRGAASSSTDTGNKPTPERYGKYSLQVQIPLGDAVVPSPPQDIPNEPASDHQLRNDTFTDVAHQEKGSGSITSDSIPTSSTTKTRHNDEETSGALQITSSPKHQTRLCQRYGSTNDGSLIYCCAETNHGSRIEHCAHCQDVKDAEAMVAIIRGKWERRKQAELEQGIDYNRAHSICAYCGLSTSSPDGSDEDDDDASSPQPDQASEHEGYNRCECANYFAPSPQYDYAEMA